MRAGEHLGLTDVSASWTITNARDDMTQNTISGYQAVLDINIDMKIPHYVLLAD
jgi:hypothetical protein